MIQTGRYDKESNIFHEQKTGLTCGIAVQQSVKYTKHEDKDGSGRIWLVGNTNNAADYIYCGFTKHTGSHGFAGRWMNFGCADGEVVKIQGPWHSNAEDLYKHTGVDIRNKYLTFVVVAATRKHDEHYNTFYENVFYIDDEPTVGTFDRGEEIAQKIANKRKQEVMYYRASTGGSSSGSIYPRE
jgi:hypothetical protein